MPSPGSSASRTRHRTLVFVFLIALALGVYAFLNVGRFLTTDDPLQSADAIAVLAGTRMDRPLEAVDLYRRGLAPRIVLTRQTSERSFKTLAQQGIVLPADAEITRDVLVRLGIPGEAIVVPSTVHDNTAQEAQTIRQLAMDNRWRRLIIVTSKYHVRRARFALRRELAGTGIEVEVRGSRYEDVNPDRWWTRRADWRWVLSEGGKLVAYELGLGA